MSALILFLTSIICPRITILVIAATTAWISTVFGWGLSFLALCIGFIVVPRAMLTYMFAVLSGDIHFGWIILMFGAAILDLGVWTNILEKKQ